MRTTPVRRLTCLALGTVLLSSGCGADDGGSGGSATAQNGESIQVFAAASLNETFTELGELFEEDHGVSAEFNFAGSSDLVAQLEQGAPGDVFASADEANMDSAVEAGLVAGEPSLFASNTLTIVTPPGNPAEVEDLEDLADNDVVTVVCAPQVPCGAATEQVTEAAGVALSPASEESAVTDVLGKVRAGEADAGLVYVTDARGAGEDVETIDFPEAHDVVNLYPGAALESSGNPEASEAFVEFLQSTEAQEILAEAGFQDPDL